LYGKPVAVGAGVSKFDNISAPNTQLGKSVEIRENPLLANAPVAVGGQPSRRGVIATCNYIARQFGVHSAMASSHALRICPDLVFVTPNFPLYKQVSNQIREIMLRYTDIIEPLSLDEAYLDVSDSAHFNGSATRIAEAIRRDVKNELNLCVSAGIAPNKFLAKIASDWEKPDGLFVITPDQIHSFIQSLPVNKINGVGKVTTKKLNDLNIHTCGDLYKFEEAYLIQKFGSYGSRLYQLARGVDNRPVQTTRIRKSLSVEYTFSKDLQTIDEILKNSERVFNELCERADKLSADTRLNKRFVKVKFNDFTQTTLEEMISPSLPISQSAWRDTADYSRMLRQAWRRSEKPIRLLGMGVRLVTSEPVNEQVQLDLFQPL